MYLTRLTLDLRGRAVRRDLASAYEMHRTLARAFAPDETTPPERFLWRLETPGLGRGHPVVLVQSAKPGFWSPIAAEPNYLRRKPEEKVVDISTLLRDGRRMRFRLLANPTVARNRKRYALFREDEQLAWLKRQSERYGFDVNGAVITARDLIDSRKDARKITIQRVLYDGYLTVTDPALLSAALVAGIGPAKAFGCGLLSLALA